MEYQTQLSKLTAMMDAGRWHDALKLAARWQDLGDQKAAITRGDAALKHPEFYRQLGQDPDKLVELGIAALRTRYGRFQGSQKG